MAPVRRYERQLLDRMKENASDSTMAILTFLALHGAQFMAMLRVDVLREEEMEAVLAHLRDQADGGR